MTFLVQITKLDDIKDVIFYLGMILVTSSFVTFWIEWNAEPARVTLGVTTMLNFFTTSNK